MHPIWLLRPTLLTKIMTAKSTDMNGRLPDKAVTRQRIFRLVKKMGGIAGKTGGIVARMCAIAGKISRMPVKMCAIAGKISGMPVTIS
jgi:hypothetical protein